MARHDHSVVGIGAPGPGGEHDPAAPWTDDEHLADPPLARSLQAEVMEEGDAAWPDQVAAGLVARERRLVDQRHTGPPRASTSAVVLPPGPPPATKTS